MKKTALLLSLAIVFALGCKNDDPEPETKRTTIYDTVLTTLTVYDTVRVPIMCDHSWVVYVLNNETDEVDTLDIKNGASIKLKSDVTRFGYDFVKWSTSPTGGGTDYVAGDNYYVNKDITLYAIWQSHDGLRSNEVYEFLSKQESGSTVNVKIIDLDPDIDAIFKALDKFWKVNVNLDLGDAIETQSLAFGNISPNLKFITFPPNIQALTFLYGTGGLTTLDNIPFSVRQLQIGGSENISTLVIPNGVKTLSVYGCTKLTSINIPNSVTDICFFDKNSSLTEITLPSSVEIDDLGFQDCTNLKTIKHSLKECSYVDITGCENLESIIIPECRPGTWLHVGNNYKLKTVTIQATIPPTLDGSFYPITSTIYVPSSAVDAYKTADRWKDYADQIVGY